MQTHNFSSDSQVSCGYKAAPSRETTNSPAHANGVTKPFVPRNSKSEEAAESTLAAWFGRGKKVRKQLRKKREKLQLSWHKHSPKGVATGAETSEKQEKDKEEWLIYGIF